MKEMVILVIKCRFLSNMYYYGKMCRIEVTFKEDICMSAKKTNFMKLIAKGMVLALSTILRVQANSTSCIIIHQPKTPKGLGKFRRNK